MLGIRFLATEYSTGKTYCGRIDSLSIDENRAPEIIDYKRALNANVIKQSLFYLCSFPGGPEQDFQREARSD